MLMKLMSKRVPEHFISRVLWRFTIERLSGFLLLPRKPRSAVKTESIRGNTKIASERR